MHHAVVLTEDAFDFGHDFAPNLLACYHRLEPDESELLHGKSDPRNLLLGDSREPAIAVNDSITTSHPLAVLPILGLTSDTVVNPPPPPLFFRIIGLRTFSRQPIEPQWFISKFFNNSYLRKGKFVHDRQLTRSWERGALPN